MGTSSATAPETPLPRAGGRPRLLQGQAQWARQATCPAQPSSARRTPSPDQPPRGRHVAILRGKQSDMAQQQIPAIPIIFSWLFLKNKRF